MKYEIVVNYDSSKGRYIASTESKPRYAYYADTKEKAVEGLKWLLNETGEA